MLKKRETDSVSHPFLCASKGLLSRCKPQLATTEAQMGETTTLFKLVILQLLHPVTVFVCVIEYRHLTYGAARRAYFLQRSFLHCVIQLTQPSYQYITTMSMTTSTFQGVLFASASELIVNNFDLTFGPLVIRGRFLLTRHQSFRINFEH